MRISCLFLCIVRPRLTAIIMNFVNVNVFGNYFTVVFLKSMHLHLSIQKSVVLFISECNYLLNSIDIRY